MKRENIINFLKNDCIDIPFNLIVSVRDGNILEPVYLSWSHTEYFLRAEGVEHNITRYVKPEISKNK